MSLSMYQASSPRFVKSLTQLSAILDKAQAHCEAKKIEPATLAGMRLIADMFPLSRQVQVACDSAKGAVARLAGLDIPKHDDTEQTLAELKQRIAKTIDYVLSMSPDNIDGSEERPVTLRLGGRDVTFTGIQYLLGFAYPNFYFHVTTAYDILRANGIELGKRDYIGTP